MKVFEAAAAAMRAGKRAAMATLISVDGSVPRHSGARMLIFDDGTIVGTVGGGALEHTVRQQATEAMVAEKPRRVSLNLRKDLGMICGGATEVFIEPLLLPPKLYLFGAGHIGQAMAAVCQTLGFQITVIDQRPAYTQASMFPGCQVICADPADWARNLETDDRTYLVLANHSHVVDFLVLEVLCCQRWAYLGVVASKNKVVDFCGRLRKAGVDEQWLQRISTPVGLDIGAETPAEIAISIAAEIIRVLRLCTRCPEPLCEVPLPIRGGDGKALPPRLAAMFTGKTPAP